MADFHSSTCDICKVHKGEANHWWRVWREAEDGLIVIGAWSYEVRTKHFHACGEQHALQIAAQLLGEKRVEATPEVQE